MMIQFKKYWLLTAVLVVICAFVSCSKRGASDGAGSSGSEGRVADGARLAAEESAAVAFADLKKTGSMSLR